MHEDRRTLQRLHQGRHHGVLEQDRHRARDLDLLGRDHIALLVEGDHDLAQPRPKIFHRRGQGQDGHDFGSDTDVVACRARDAVLWPALANQDGPQAAVVHVDHPAQTDAVGVNVELVAVEKMIVHRRAHQVVGGADGMNIAGQMQVEVFHRHDLGISAARRAALDPEGRAHAGLPDAGEGLFPELVQGLGQADGGGGLPLAQRGGGDGGDVDIVPVGLVLQPVPHIEMDLGFSAAIVFEVVFGETDAGRDLTNGQDFGGLGDIEVRRNGA